MTDTIKISRELANRLSRLYITDKEHGDHEAAVLELRAILATPPADAADMGGQHIYIALSRELRENAQVLDGDLPWLLTRAADAIDAIHTVDEDHVAVAYGSKGAVSTSLAQHRQQAGKLAEALRNVRRSVQEAGLRTSLKTIDEALADWEKTNGQ